MTLHQIAPLIQAFLAMGVLALVVTRGGFSRSSTRWFALFVLGQLLWGLTVFGLRGSSDLTWALRWERLTPAAVSLAAFSFFLFARAVARMPAPRWVVILIVAHLLASLASIPTSYIVAGVEVADYGNTAVWGSGLLPWTGIIYLLMVLSFVALYRGFRSASSYTERNRLLLMLIAAFFSVLGSLMDVAPVLGLDVPPATSYTNSLFFILTGIAILRFQLLDIQVTLQHRIAYALRSLTTLATVGIAIVLVWLLDLPLWSAVLLALVSLLLAEPVWRKLDDLLRTRLEKNLQSDLQVLLTIGTGHEGISDGQIADTVIKLTQRVLHSTHNAFLALRDDALRPIAAQGYTEAPGGTIANAHPLFRWLKDQAEPVFHQDVAIEPWFQSLSPQSLGAVTSLGADIYVPLIAHGTLEGLLAVGPKAKQAIYSWQETAFLAALGQQAALLLESMRLAKADLAQRERMERLREVQRSMVEAREEERRSLASDIHDDPIQMLVGSLVRLNLIRESLISRPDLVKQQLDHVVTNINRAEHSLRRIMRGIFPSLLQDLGLLPALEALCQDLADSGVVKGPLHLRITVNGVLRSWNPPLPVALGIYRFTQEGLRNVVAHASASEALVNVHYRTDGVTMEVLDNGRGIDPERATRRRQEGHVGLLGLEERLGAQGGNVTINNRPEGGTRLWGEFPHQAPTPEPEAQWVFEYDITPLSAQATDQSPRKPSVPAVSGTSEGADALAPAADHHGNR